MLRVGRSVRSVGAGLTSTLAPAALGVPASELVDQIVLLQDLWTPDDVERLFTSLSRLEIRRSASALKHELVARIGRPKNLEPVGQTASRLIKLHAGRVSIADMARSYGMSRQRFARKFCAAAGLPPKLFA